MSTADTVPLLLHAERHTPCCDRQSSPHESRTAYGRYSRPRIDVCGQYRNEAHGTDGSGDHADTVGPNRGVARRSGTGVCRQPCAQGHIPNHQTGTAGHERFASACQPRSARPPPGVTRRRSFSRIHPYREAASRTNRRALHRVLRQTYPGSREPARSSTGRSWNAIVPPQSSQGQTSPCFGRVGPRRSGVRWSDRCLRTAYRLRSVVGR